MMVSCGKMKGVKKIEDNMSKPSWTSATTFIYLIFFFAYWEHACESYEEGYQQAETVFGVAF